MSDKNFKLSLGYTPDNGKISDAGLVFLESYTLKLYPRYFHAFGIELRKSVNALVNKAKPSAYDYTMLHYVNTKDNRYSFEEKFFDREGENGFQISLQPSSEEERNQIAKCQEDPDNSTSSVDVVIAYLKNSLEHESEHWIGSVSNNGACSITIARELMNLLKRAKNVVRVMDFSFTINELGPRLQLILVAPSVINYHARVDWSLG